MPLRLNTFGTLQLLDAQGQPVPGVGAQPKPLLILALVALQEHGLMRSRLRQALWPDVPVERANAVLKQHLYALRQVTGDAKLIGGSPKLEVARDRLLIDAFELERLVRAGDLNGATALLRGEVLEGAEALGGPHLQQLISELRERFAPMVSIAASADRLRRRLGMEPGVSTLSLPMMATERTLRDAVQRAVRRLSIPPDDGLVAEWRATSVLSDLLESLRLSQLHELPPTAVVDLLEPIRALVSRIDAVRRLTQEHGAAGPSEAALEWMTQGRPLSNGPMERGIELALLASPFCAQFRSRNRWLDAQLGLVMSRPAEASLRVLAIGLGRWEALPPSVPAMVRARPHLMIVDERPLDLAVLRSGFRGAAADIECRQATIDTLAAEVSGPRFDVIMLGTLLDDRPLQEVVAVVSRLCDRLVPGGQLLFDLPSGRSWVDWSRFVLSWPVQPWQLDDVALITGHLLPGAIPLVRSDPDGGRWQVTLTRRVALAEVAA